MHLAVGFTSQELRGSHAVQISSQSWDSQPANHAHSLTNGGALDHYAAQDRTGESVSCCLHKMI